MKSNKTSFKRGHKTWNKGRKMPEMFGKNNPSYKGGRSIMSNGYIRVLIEGTGSYQLEHRLIIEKYLGRKLKRNEVVHHKNGNRQDNKIENLELMTNGKHISKHLKGNKFNLGHKLPIEVKRKISESIKNAYEEGRIKNTWSNNRDRNIYGKFI